MSWPEFLNCMLWKKLSYKYVTFDGTSNLDNTTLYHVEYDQPNFLLNLFIFLDQNKTTKNKFYGAEGGVPIE